MSIVNRVRGDVAPHPLAVAVIAEFLTVIGITLCEQTADRGYTRLREVRRQHFDGRFADDVLDTVTEHLREAVVDVNDRP